MTQRYWKYILAKTNSNILKIDDLSVSYGVVKALNHVNIEVNEGEIVGLIGANGAGKSTLLESVLAMHDVNGGTIKFLGQDITHSPTDKIVASGASLLPEGRGIVPLMTVLENLQLGGYYLKAGELGRNLEHIYGRFPILSKRHSQQAGTLSGGEQQMLSIGRSLMSRPRLLMMDEPSLGLAPVIVKQLFKTIAGLNSEGYTILLSEQNAHKVLECAHRVYLLDKGSVILTGASSDVARNPAVHQAYLGMDSLSTASSSEGSQ